MENNKITRAEKCEWTGIAWLLIASISHMEFIKYFAFFFGVINVSIAMQLAFKENKEEDETPR